MMYRSRLIALNDPDSLKEAIKGVLFEVDCPEPGRAESILANLPEVMDVATHGVILHVLVRLENSKLFLENVLRDNGIAVNRFERILPSLEDVFVSLVNQENRSQLRAGIE